MEGVRSVMKVNKKSNATDAIKKLRVQQAALRDTEQKAEWS